MAEPNYNKTLGKFLIVLGIIILFIIVLFVVRSFNTFPIEEQYCKQLNGNWSNDSCLFKDGTNKSKEQLSLEINSTV